MHSFQCLYQLGGVRLLIEREAAIHSQVQLCIGKLKPTMKLLFEVRRGWRSPFPVPDSVDCSQ